MIQIKVTNILLNPFVKSEYSVDCDKEEDVDGAILDILKQEQTEKEDLARLIRKYNSSVKRFNKGLTDSIVIYTHPTDGVILRIVIEIYKKIAKEVYISE